MDLANKKMAAEGFSEIIDSNLIDLFVPRSDSIKGVV